MYVCMRQWKNSAGMRGGHGHDAVFFLLGEAARYALRHGGGAHSMIIFARNKYRRPSQLSI